MRVTMVRSAVWVSGVRAGAVFALTHSHACVRCADAAVAWTTVGMVGLLCSRSARRSRIARLVANRRVAIRVQCSAHKLCVASVCGVARCRHRGGCW
jgi:hypothetical protein